MPYRDPVITLTVLTDTADTREVALTFARQTPGERRREADEWVKTLKRYVADTVSHPADMVTDTPVPGESPAGPYRFSGDKKKIEISSPIKKITVDTSHLPPKPVETTSLPEGSFCGRCGNRIPPGSTFCNRYVPEVVVPGEDMAVSAAPGRSLWPRRSFRAGRSQGQAHRTDHPLYRTPDRGLGAPHGSLRRAVPEPAAAQQAGRCLNRRTRQYAFAAAAAAVAGTRQDAPSSPPAWPVPPLPPVPEAPRKRGRKVLAAAIIIIVIILLVVAGGFVAMNTLHKTAVVTPVVTPVPTTTIHTPTVTPTAVPTTVVTIAAVPTTPQSLVPQTGVWVEITYDKTYSGLIGTPGMQQGVSDTGDHFYRIPTTDGTVAVSIQKTDGSGDELKVILYNNGITVKTISTTTPKGNIDLQYSLATPTPTPTPVLTPLPTLPLSSNATTTVNTTNSTA